jgi:hypothetical protein
MASSFNMTPIWLGHICNFSIQLVFTGAPVGTFKLQCSNDPGTAQGPGIPQATGVVNWTDIADSGAPITAAGDLVYQYENAGFPWVRVVYTATSGSGSLTSARANVKGV